MKTPHSAVPAFARGLIALACAASVAAPSGCSVTDDPASSAASDETRMDKTMHDSTDPTHNPVPDEVMARLLDEAAADSGMSRDAIVLVRAERATWPDASRGCPQPNIGYPQVIVQGYWVLLRAGRQEYDYRIGPDLDHIRCTGATKQAPILYPDT